MGDVCCLLIATVYMQGRIAYALFTTARTAPQTTATALQIRAIQGVCNKPIRRCSSFVDCVLRVCAARYISPVRSRMNHITNRLTKCAVIFPRNIKNSPEPVQAPARSSQQLYYKVMFRLMPPWRLREFPLPWRLPCCGGCASSHSMQLATPRRARIAFRTPHRVSWRMRRSVCSRRRR